MPLKGEVTGSNSLLGKSADDQVCSGGVVVLDGSNGNFVVSSPRYQNGTYRVGAATWGSGTVGVSGAASLSNSLLGCCNLLPLASADVPAPMTVTALKKNGNYTVALCDEPGGSGDGVGGVWGVPDSRCPVTFVNGNTGAVGYPIAASTSYSVGYEKWVKVVPLSNGNYVVVRSSWGPGSERGAVSWGSGTTGLAGPVNTSNALTGANDGDRVGDGGVVPLANGNYVVVSPSFGYGSTTALGG
jgi:hypothetical protein